MARQSNTQAALDILAKSRNEDGSFGGGPVDHDGGGVESEPTDQEAAAAAALLNQDQEEQTDDDIDQGGEAAAAAEDEQELGEGEAEGSAEGLEGEEAEDVTLTPAELGDAIGWEANDVYEGIMVPLDDGQEPMPLGDLKNGYQDQRRKITELEGQLQEAANAAQPDENMVAFQQTSQEMQEVVAYMKQLDRTEQNTDWAQLEYQDPAQAVLRRQKLQDARTKAMAHARQLHEKETQQRNQMMEKSRQKMLELIPTWKDDNVRRADQGKMRELMKGFGYADQEINMITDPRGMAMAREHMALKAELAQYKEASERARKTVRNAPKVLRGEGGRFESPDPNKNVQKIVQRAKKTGRRQDQLEAARAILGESQRGQHRSVSGRQPSRRVVDREGHRR